MRITQLVAIVCLGLAIANPGPGSSLAAEPSRALFEDVHAVKMPKQKFGYRGNVGDIEVLKDGRLLMCYTSRNVDITSSVSTDKGRTWSKPVILVSRPKPYRKDEEYWHPSLLRLKNGQLMLSYIYFSGAKPRYAHTYYRRSLDDGKTWGDQLIATPYRGTNHCFNDKLIQLPSGRILISGELEAQEKGGDHRGYISFVFYSDDNGYSWHRSKNVVNTLPVEAQEPHVVLLKDKRLMMLCRTYSGYIVRAYSKDQGTTWSKGEHVRELKMSLNASALNVKRIPSTGDLLLLRCTGAKGGYRTPFASAISKDDGRTWIHERAIAKDPNDDYGYPSLTFTQGMALISYHKRDGIYVARIGIDWFYGK